MIDFADKTTGDVFTAAELNMIKQVVNGNQYADVTKLQKGLPDPVNGEIRVSGGYLIAGTVNIGDNVIVLEGDTEFISHNPGTDILIYTGTGAAITGTGYGFTSFFTTYVAPAGKVFNLTGAADKMFSLFYCGISSQAQASTIRTFGDLASTKLTYILDGAGIEFGGVCGKASFFVCPFRNITGREITLLDDFEGLLALSNNFFKDMGGEYIEITDLTNVRGRITDNDFPDSSVENFVGFSEESPSIEVYDNTNQIDSGTFLDAVFDGTPVQMTVGTEWVDVDLPYEVEYAQRFEYEAATNSFVHTGLQDALILSFFSYVAIADSNNSDYQFAIFADTGAGFTQITRTQDVSFRQSDDTKPIMILDRIPIPPGAKLKAMVKKPSGSSVIEFITSKVAV